MAVGSGVAWLGGCGIRSGMTEGCGIRIGLADGCEIRIGMTEGCGIRSGIWALPKSSTLRTCPTLTHPALAPAAAAAAAAAMNGVWWPKALQHTHSTHFQPICLHSMELTSHPPPQPVPAAQTQSTKQQSRGCSRPCCTWPSPHLHTRGMTSSMFAGRCKAQESEVSGPNQVIGSVHEGEVH